MALAGVMGGLATEVTDTTSTVLLESATFDPVSIRRTAHRLTLRSEASRRFEKGLPPELTVLALRRCVQLIEEIGAGQGEFLTADAYPAPSDPAPVLLEFDRIERLMASPTIAPRSGRRWMLWSSLSTRTATICASHRRSGVVTSRHRRM